MPQRHSKNNNDLAIFTYEEKRRLGYGTQRERLGKDSVKPFDACCLCLKTVLDPMCCRKGHLFCKECIFECLLQQKKDIRRQTALFAAQSAATTQEAKEKEEKARERMLEAFDKQNSSAVPSSYQDIQKAVDDGDNFHGISSNKVTTFEEDALKNMKAFWLPSKTPEAANRVEAPPSDTLCPEGREKLRLKDLFPVRFKEVKEREKKNEDMFQCPSCSTTFTNASKIKIVPECGHVLCARCAELFVVKDQACCVCNKSCKPKHLVELQKGGTGFASHNEELVAKVFKPAGSMRGLDSNTSRVR